MTSISNNRPWPIKVMPLWLKEKLFWRFYLNQSHKYVHLFENATLEFAPNISLDLMTTDISHQQIAFCGFYELPVSRNIFKLAKQGGLMLDVGANYGYYSCLWAAGKKSNKVIAFEASPRNLSALNLNLVKNKITSQVKVNETAVGKEKGYLFFDIGPKCQSGWGGLVTHKQLNTIEVAVISLDDIFLSPSNKYEHIDVLKIDTEGADTWVLQGARKLLQAQKISHIFFEENLPRMSAIGIKPGEAQELLKESGYSVTKIYKNEWYGTIQ